MAKLLYRYYVGSLFIGQCDEKTSSTWHILVSNALRGADYNYSIERIEEKSSDDSPSFIHVHFYRNETPDFDMIQEEASLLVEDGYLVKKE